MNVNGICPPLTLVNDTTNININTIPEAPKSPVLKKVTFRIPVIKAVKTIISKVNLEPYFSSTIGPKSKMKVKLPNKCSMLLCPKTCENKLKMETGFDQLILVPTAKRFIVIPGNNIFPKNTTEQIRENVRMTGELYFILTSN